MRTVLVALASLLLCGCTEEGASLFVELRTDLVSGAEFFAVEAVLDDTNRMSSPAIGTQDFYAGQRIAEYEDLEVGAHVLVVRLLDAEGAEVASRRTRIDVDGQLALTVLVSRDCQGVTCGVDQTCVHGSCASTDCHEELNPSACGTFECTSASECDAPAAACAVAECDFGACLSAPVADTCGATEYCDVEVGCRPRGPSLDAAVDAQPDAPDTAPPTDSGAADTNDAAARCGEFPGLLGHWTMDAADISGDQVRDSSGNGQDGTWRGSAAPTVVPGRIGDAIDWSGTTTAFVDLPDTLSLDTTPGGFNTVSMWYRRDGPVVDEAPLFIPFDPETAPPRYGIWLNTERIGSPVLCINTGSGECWGVADPTVTDRWVHVIVGFANGPTAGGSMYLDGVPVAMSCVFGSCDESRTAGPPLTIGGADPDYDYHGLIDDVRLYNRALTPAEAAALFACSD